MTPTMKLSNSLENPGSSFKAGLLARSSPATSWRSPTSKGSPFTTVSTHSNSDDSRENEEQADTPKERRRTWSRKRVDDEEAQRDRDEEEGRMSRAAAYAKLTQEREEKERTDRKLAVQGRLKTLSQSLDHVYHQMEGDVNWMDRQVRIKLIKGKDLPICDARKSDPYVRFTLGEVTRSSTVIRSNLNPTWNETFHMKVPGKGVKNILHVDVYDQDLLPVNYEQHEDDHMGGFTISLEDEIGMEGPVRKWYKLKGGDLKDIKGKPQVQNGQIELEILFSFSPPAMRERGSTVFARNRQPKVGTPGILPVMGVEADKGHVVEEHSRLTDDTKRMVLVSLVGRLRHVSSEMRRMAVQSLARAAGRHGILLPQSGDWHQLIVKNLTERIVKDQVSEVRLDALEALVMISNKGDEEAIKAVAAALRDKERDVRHAAVGAMRQIAKSGDEVAIFSVAERLEDSDYKVRETAGEVLSKLSTVHDQRLVSQVLLRLKNIHSVIRKNAVRTLVTLSTPGSPQVLEGLIVALKDPDTQVRIAAMQVLVSQVTRGDELAVDLVLQQLQDKLADVRAAAAECLAEIAGKGEKRVIWALVQRLQDDGKDLYGHLIVRTAVLRAISVLASSEEGVPISPRTKSLASRGAVESMNEEDWGVRKSAAQALAAVCSSTDADIGSVLEKLVAMLEDKNAQVRMQAADTLCALANPEDRWLNAVLAVKLIIPQAEVRSLVGSVLQTHIVNAELDGDITLALKQRSPSMISSVFSGGDRSAAVSPIGSRGLGSSRSLLSDAIPPLDRGTTPDTASTYDKGASFDSAQRYLGDQSHNFGRRESESPEHSPVNRRVSGKGDAAERRGSVLRRGSASRGSEEASETHSRRGSVASAKGSKRGSVLSDKSVRSDSKTSTPTTQKKSPMAIPKLERAPSKLERAPSMRNAFDQGHGSSGVNLSFGRSQSVAGGVGKFERKSSMSASFDLGQATLDRRESRAGGTEKWTKSDVHRGATADSPSEGASARGGRRESLVASLTSSSKMATAMAVRSAERKRKESTVSMVGSVLGDTMEQYYGALSFSSPYRGKTPTRGRSRSPSKRAQKAWVADVVDFLRKVKQGRVCTSGDAVRILVMCVNSGFEGAIKGLLWSLNHDNAEVRQVAIEGLRQLAKIGDKGVVSTLQKRLKHPKWEFRRDAAIALSLVAKKHDSDVVDSILSLMDDEVREVREAVETAAKNMFYPGDDRIVMASACVRLEQQFHTEIERQEALERLGNLAYASSHVKLQGYTVEDAEMESFWHQIRMPESHEQDTHAVLPKILKLFSDNDAWVRRAAVRAAVQSTQPGNQEVMRELEKLLLDDSFTVRVVAATALADLSDRGDQNVIKNMIKILDDHSHLVRIAAVNTLTKIVERGDRRTAHTLLNWIRQSWQYNKDRGNDTEVKLGLAEIVIPALGLNRNDEPSQNFLQGLGSQKLHTQRNAVARFEDWLTLQGLFEPKYLQQYFKTQAHGKNYGPEHRKAAVKIQKWLRSIVLVRMASRYKRKQLKFKAQFKKAPASKEVKVQRKKELLWFMRDQDALAEKVIRNRVPEQIRSTAMAAAHERVMAGEEDSELWDRMRWTERLRLCEETAGHSWQMLV